MNHIHQPGRFNKYFITVRQPIIRCLLNKTVPSTFSFIPNLVRILKNAFCIQSPLKNFNAIQILFFAITLSLSVTAQNQLPSINHFVMTNAYLDKDDQLIIKPSATSSSSDFDFLFGSHLVHHKKLKQRLSNNSDWVTFEGKHFMEALLEGRGNMEKHEMPDDSGHYTEGIALRLFDPKTRLWTIHWSDSRSCKLDAPVTGSFEGATGYFYGTDIFKGRPILIAFEWDATDPSRPVWK